MNGAGMADGLPVERLREFLRELKPPARALLISELERGLLRGDEIPGTDLVLQELRRTLRAAGHAPPRIGNPARLFFNPIEPFIVDDEIDHKHPGRVARAALEPVWMWISRDLLPEESKEYSADVSQALLAGDGAQCDLLTRMFQDKAAQRMEAALAAIVNDDKALRRLAGQIGMPAGLEIVKQVLGLLKARDMLVAFGSQLPGHFNLLAGAQLENAKLLLDNIAVRSPPVFLYALVLVMSRLVAPWQLIRLATQAADSDNAARVAGSPYAVAVTMVLTEVERLVADLKSDLKSGRGIAVIALLKALHDAARGLRTELDLAGDSAWGRQLAAIRTEISNLLKSEIESMPGRVRRLLRPRPAKEISSGSVLDPADVAEAEALIGFVDACRKYAGELAINEMTQRTFSELQQYLEVGTPALLDGIRHATDADRRFRQSQADAAVRFCAKAFGQEYAAQLAKAAEVAANSERKAAAKA
jgi:hypothetical protein